MDLPTREAQLWFNATNRIFDIMVLRGYTAIDYERPETLAQFRQEYLPKWQKLRNNEGENHRNAYMKFEKPHHIMFVGMYVNIQLNKAASTAIVEVLEQAKKISNPEAEQSDERIATQIRAIIVSKKSDLVNQTAKSLRNLGPTSIPRSEQDPHITRIKLQYFSLEELQTDPLNHVMQSQVLRHITDEDEKERLRLQTVSGLTNKDSELREQLPLIWTTDPVVKWYGAEVGDVFFFLRKLGRKPTIYYRYVVPSLERN